MKLFKMSDVTELTGLGKSTIYKEIAAGRFPGPVKIAERSVVWLESDLTSWLNDKIQQQNVADGGRDREYVSDLRQGPSTAEILKFIDEALEIVIDAADREMESIYRRLRSERAELVQQAIAFLDEKGGRDKL